MYGIDCRTETTQIAIIGAANVPAHGVVALLCFAATLTRRADFFGFSSTVGSNGSETVQFLVQEFHINSQKLPVVIVAAAFAPQTSVGREANRFTFLHSDFLGDFI
jgi:hypothetical protein